jgi:hypothetical protein
LGIFAGFFGSLVYRTHLIRLEPSLVVSGSMIVIALLGAAITVQGTKIRTARATRARWLRSLQARIWTPWRTTESL